MQKRELWKVIVLGIITLGIYDLYWVYKTRQELLAKGGDVPSFWLLFVPVIGFLVAGTILLLTNSASDLNNGTLQTSAANVTAITIMVIAGLIAIPISIYWFYKYSQAVEKVTEGQTTTAFSFGMWAVLNLVGVGFIWPALVQNNFNHIGAESQERHTPMTASPA